ncbi:MAG TPA: hypothetical protein VNX40_05425 [Mucilaginibacter sp.]|jgi:hypothetical protein|nr:hypothetical protein [Mucilaginibacter sp.]
MANITTLANLVGNVLIPDTDMVGTNLTWYIQEYEPIFLKKIMGSDLYTAYLASPGDARFTAIIGTVGPPSTGYLAKSLVNYIFYQYFEGVVTQTTTLGATQAKVKNAVRVSMWPQMVNAWNRMAESNRCFHKYMVDNAATYPEYKVCFPQWFFGWGFWGGIWSWGFFDWYNWDGEFGICVDEIYRFKNRIGL